MSLRRIRKLAGLTESIADTPELNADIERRLDALPKETRTLVLDALEQLKLAGQLTLTDWATKIRAVHGDADQPMGEVLKTAVKQFPFVVQKVAPKTYAWKVATSSSDEEVVDPAMAGAIDAQIRLKDRAFAVIRANGGRFTAKFLKDRLPRSISRPIIDQFVDHFLTAFQGMLTKEGNVYTFHDEPPSTREQTMQSFRDIVNKPGTE